ncbi:MAG: transketolase [Chitinophaga sp.]|jgi:pyruvate/2-oxoglutarate/acetoin dehydrogenase E1 component/TPP-dependent pyruvate/acetoin dehydrogenase alpha subunit|nr:transketolase [Chitinophaga sp.]
MEQTITLAYKDDMLSYEGFKNQVLEDYRIAMISREASLLGRREVLTGKAKFGIFGDGKEVAQIAMAKFFRAGDYRAGYYRDQTFMFSTGLASVEQFFSQLYADPDVHHDPFSAGRQMVSHFATRFTDETGNWLDLANRKNVTSDMAPTASQMPRAVGLALASKLFRQTPQLKGFDNLSHNGNEICFCTIGDASTSEGHFWEAINAAGVQQIPLAVFVWDDGYGISVPKKYQTTKGSISAALRGMQKEDKTNGINIYKVKGWDYAGMCEVFESALHKMRETHVPAVFHVEEITQPQGHSTSGSHERYKDPKRLEWEREWDCVKKFKEWITENNIATEEELSDIEHEAKDFTRTSKQRAWEKFIAPLNRHAATAVNLISNAMVHDMETYNNMQHLATQLKNNAEPLRRDILHTLALAMEAAPDSPSISSIKEFYNSLLNESRGLHNTFLYNQGPRSALKVEEVKPLIPFDAVSINAYEVLNKYFDTLFTNHPLVFAFGEDVGMIGDVNQGFAGLQQKHGSERIFDTGIRELTIMGQAIGMALRGLRPIAEIQYLDYLLYGLQALSDDAATTHFRTYGQQSCPLIVRTRGHRLEGIWHSGSPMGMIINALRGMYVCVPRNMVQAIGMYNTLLQGNDPAIVIECLNGYRLKEKAPANLLEFTVPLGVTETIKEGTDVTIVSYGSMLRIIQEASERLEKQGISCEIIDVQTLLPFDINHNIVASLQKTNRILFVDEDVPGGAAAYMYNEVMEKQGGYRWVDAAPRTLTAQAHRPAYGSDGDYFSKPNTEDVIRVVNEMMSE